MALESGSRLGAYEISGLVGKGGMGEVYRARDTRLGREVAIKVLPQEFAQDTERLARLEREARMLASLNHPNVASIYGLEQSEGTRFLVLELVEGETLGERIQRGPIPVADALELALEIAEALEAAHEKGVIHRDLKPANIKVTPGGKVKVLDFGLAKAFAGDREDVNLSNSPTLSLEATRAGIILGTAAYMAPEQASGGASDKRADIWSFGVVLFELLTGRPVFAGDTVPHVLAAVLAKDPQWASLPPNLHPKIRELLERCLEKDPKDRYHDVADVRIDIQKMRADPGGLSAPEVGATVHSSHPSRLAWVAAVVVAAGAAALAGWWLKPQEPGRVSRMVIPLADTEQFPITGCPAPPIALSPDGTTLVYSANGRLYVREMDDFQARALGETEGARGPFFSPDGQWIGFVADGVLKKVTTTGGTPQTLADGGCFGFWAEDDTILFVGGPLAPISQVSASGGEVEPLSGTAGGFAPQLLPGGQSLLFAAGGEIVVQGVDGSDRKTLLNGVHARYVPTGHLVYATSTTPTLMAVPFDVETLELTGNPAPMVEGVLRADTVSTYQFSVSDSGTLAYLPGAATATEAGLQLVMADRDGNLDAVSAERRNYADPRVSPAGDRIAVEITDTVGGMTSTNIWVVERATGIHTQITFDGTLNQFPCWTPDGRSIVFASNRTGSGIYIQSADGVGGAERIHESAGDLIPTHISVDGVLVFSDDSRGNWDLWTLRLGEGSAPEVFLATDAGEYAGWFSPDGRALSYSSDVSGQNEGYVRPFPRVDETLRRLPISRTGAAVWYPDGEELVYVDLVAGGYMAIATETSPAVTLGQAVPLFPVGIVQAAPPISGAFFPGYGPAPDKHLVFASVASDPASRGSSVPRINVVLNWFTELGERVPVD